AIPRRSPPIPLSVEGRGASAVSGVPYAWQPRGGGETHHGQPACVGLDCCRVPPYRRGPHGSDSRRERRPDAGHQEIRPLEKRALLCLCRLVVPGLYPPLPLTHLSAGQDRDDSGSAKTVL